MNVYPAAELYAPLFKILEDAGLRTTDDIAARVKDRGPWAFSTENSGWANDFVSVLEGIFADILALHKKTVGNTIVHERLDAQEYEPFDSQGVWDENPFEVSGRYGALFPGRILFIGDSIMTYDDENSVTIQRSFIYQIVTLKPLIDRGLALLLPGRTH